MKLIAKLKGFDGKIYVYDDRVVISRDTLAGILVFGHGERTFFYNSIQGVEFISGRFRIIPVGYENSSRTDGNAITWVLNRKYAKKVYQLILQKINESNKMINNKSNNISVADEILKFKKLLDDGIITKEEFESKKQELLK